MQSKVLEAEKSKKDAELKMTANLKLKEQIIENKLKERNAIIIN